jgi:hypothetical protein
MTDGTGERDTALEGFALSPQQVAYFQTFGFLKVPGLFAADVDLIREGFEEVFAREEADVLSPDNAYHVARDPRYREATRSMIPGFIDKSPKLSWLREDPRVVAVARGLLGDYTYAESDGNLFNCDVLWHLDVYGAAANTEHIKMSFYLDALQRETGALRVLPGSQFAGTTFATNLYKYLSHDPSRVGEHVGVAIDEIPSWTVEVQPGDLVVGNFRTMHGSFNGGVRRRLFTVNFAAAAAQPVRA